MDSERIRDLMMEEKRSWWPRIFAILLLLAAGGAGYWFYLHPEQLTLENVKAKAKSVLDTPVMKSPLPPAAPPEDLEPLTPNMQKSPPPPAQ